MIVGSTSDLMEPEQLEGYELSDFASVLDVDAERVTATGKGADRAKERLRRRDDGPFAVGWPILSFTDALGTRKCAPVFVATIKVELAADDQVFLTKESSFALNPALAATDGIGQMIAEQLGPLSDDVSLEMLKELISTVADSLDLPLRGFDVSATSVGLDATDGLYNTAALMSGDSAATATLIRELDELMDRSDWQHTAAAGLVTGVAMSQPTKPSSIPMVAPLQINFSQEQILQRCVNSAVTVVTGPPGTGKSQIVVNLIANAWVHKESTLITSTNNAAVDVAADRANSLARGLVIRTGNKTSREAVPDLIAQLVSGAKEMAPVDRAQAEATLIRATAARDSFYLALSRCAELENIQHVRIQLQEQLGQHVSSFGLVTATGDAIRGINSLARKFERKRFFLGFRWRRFAKLHGFPVVIESIPVTLEWLKTCVDVLDREIVLSGLSQEVGDVNAHAAEVESTWQISSLTLTSGLISDAIARNKNRFTGPSEGKSSYYGTMKANEAMIPTLKGWACTALSLHQNFPLESGLFDYVIADEASQCHLAYILPAAYRAKRLILVGDTNQLPPISKVTPEQENALALRNKISPADLTRRRLSSAIYSAFDFFSNLVGQDRVQLLNEHYRSHPQIARWFNDAFYGSALSVLTDISTFSPGSRSLFWIDTPGDASRPAKGSWVNEAEARQVVNALGELLRSNLSVGVVTPFSAQADLIDRLSRQRYGPDLLSELGFRVGTAHRFQGDERDVIIFSSVLAPGVSTQAAKWIQSERRLINVAVSRARQRLVVVGNPDIESFDCPILTSLRMFIQTVHEFGDSQIEPRFDSEAEHRAYEALVHAGLNPISKFSVEGYELDFGIIQDELKLDIEVDGDQHYESVGGNYQQLCRQDIARDRVLTRAGWRVMRVPAWECFSASTAVAGRILAIVSPQK